ncbi:MAG: ATP phosphoribosyltransferase regulatory subunit [Isosphaeraceae bacterium]|nr:ATP phosphoribosyltransferase regulatory subunit [Isosphaeraceae bacterium]
MSIETAAAERPVDLVRGTRDWMPEECARLASLEALLLDRFARAGYRPIRTPVLEFTELHERKSGAGIVAKLFELTGTGQGVCLRPELTAGIVRAYATGPAAPPLPWRVSHSGPVFRYETPRPDRLREFQQVGVERLGDAGPVADAEAIWLADWAALEAGLKETSIRVGHVGLILEMLQRSGLPAPTRAALVEMLSEAATEGQNVQALEQGLEQLAGWLQGAEGADVPVAVERVDDRGIDRLFRTLVPVIVGRRSGHEIIHRLRRKWDLGHDLLGVLESVRSQVHALAELKGSPDAVLPRLEADYAALAPDSVAALRALVSALRDYGIAPERITLDLGFGRGIGFYSQMVFEITAQTPEGPVEVCGGGRYDGLARVLGSDRDERGVGFAFGLERLGQALDAQGSRVPCDEAQGYVVVPVGAEAFPHAVALARRLRAEGVRVVLDSESKTGAGAPLVQVRGPLDAPSPLVVNGHETTLAALLRQAVGR